MGSLEFGAHRILSSSLAPSTSLPVSSKLPSLGVFLRQHPSQSPSGTVSGTSLIINNDEEFDCGIKSALVPHFCTWHWQSRADYIKRPELSG